MNNSFNVPMVVTGIVMMAITAFVILGGVKSIGKVVGLFVPFMIFSCPLYFIRGTRCDDDELEFILDVFHGLMAIPNLIGLLFLSGVVVAETNDSNSDGKKEDSPLPLDKKTRRTCADGFLSYLELANQ